MDSNFFCTDDPSHELYEGWDNETGKPGLGIFSNAVQVWSVRNFSTSTVAAAAEAFKVEPEIILAAVEAHPWMYLSGPGDDYSKLKIEHEGE